MSAAIERFDRERIDSEEPRLNGAAFSAPQSIRFTFVVIHNVNDFVVFF